MEKLSAAIRDAKLTGYRQTFFPPEDEIGSPSVIGPYSDTYITPTTNDPLNFDLHLFFKWPVHSERQEEEDWESGSNTSSMQLDIKF